ncbi:Peptidoglycan-binding Lysin subgroup [Penicillium italicum]|uniref:chitinase n=1 Tax=Penicillium italicum TaxID=40296 RepID=A0A0A2KU70_PENIT|nr:Peptidoglycan-binding Lysin subgroup [Penicillium italicum]
MKQLDRCNLPLFYGFNMYDDVDDTDTYHRILACTAYGNDWRENPEARLQPSHPVKEHKVNYEIGWSSYSEGTESKYRSLIRQMRDYIARGHLTPSKTAMLYSRFGATSAGIYIGNSLQSKDIADVALDSVDHTMTLNTSGFLALRNGTFRAIQSAFESWSNAECLDFEKSTNFTASTHFTSPMLSSIKAGNTTTSSMEASGLPLPAKSSTQQERNLLFSRAECKTEKVQKGDSCAAIAKRCGISGADFTKYNSAKSFCSKLKPGQHVCCSPGTLPDFSPKPNKDGSCATTIVGDGESCSTIGAANGLTEKDIDGFNQKTWGWTGCKNIFKDSVICISKGSPPMPAEVSDAECGPQVPGTTPPKDMSKLADINPCPLNACCNTFGHCGTTADFCTDTNTGAPGTAKAGTNGCISHCGMDIVKGNAPSEFRSIGYYESYQFKRDCLYQDVTQVDHSKYTHLHFGFGDISSDYKISIDDKLANYQFNNFKHISGPKRIISFGGWDFSTQESTYQILRQGTSAANRKKLATNIAKFVNDNNLDGVDIDWEYPSAPDIPGTPPGDKSEGANYLAFLVLLKNLLKDKSVSIAAPGSYWYLKGFPIAGISKVVDYIVFMTYDLHGQWDAGNPDAQPGCDDGSCLRSHVNLTETLQSLSLITKAGVDSGKVIVGVSSYGRSFKMADADCDGPLCKFTGDRLGSNADKADCTGTAGYISNAEINQLLKSNSSLVNREYVDAHSNSNISNAEIDQLLKRDSSRVNKHFVDDHSNSNIMVYDDTNWVAYMSPEIRAQRAKMYESLSMGGTVNWATDLEQFNDPPEGFDDWRDLILHAESGITTPRGAGNRRGNWTKFDCDNEYYRENPYWSPTTRWEKLGAADAWRDVIADWKDYRGKSGKDISDQFSSQILYFLGNSDGAKCHRIEDDSNCVQTRSCSEFEVEKNYKTGAAAVLIWNSLVAIHQMYAEFRSALVANAALVIDNTLPDLEKTFAPVPPKKSDAWLNALLGLISLGVPLVGGKFFDDVLAGIPAMAAKTSTSRDHIKSVMNAILTSPVTLAVNLKGSPAVDDWTPEKQAEFSKYMGQSLKAWEYIFKKDLENLFDGSDKSIERLTTMIADGRLLDGIAEDIPYPNKTKRKEKGTEATDAQKKLVEDGFLTTFWAYSIPAVWQASGHHPFIIDAGRSCDDKHGDKDFKSACYENRLYKLADPDGKSHDCPDNGGSPAGSECPDTPFSSPKGVQELDGKAWNGLKAEDIIIGSVKTYKQNGNENGGGKANPKDSGTFEALKRMDITTPGFMRLPVCSETLARKSWENADKTEIIRDREGFPCNNDNGKAYCTTSKTTYIEETTSDSPLIDDCLVIVKNIQGTSGSWDKPIERQFGILNFGTCTFGIEGKGRKGNIDVYIGAQDAVDIIRYTSKHWGHGTGKMQGKGVMQCDGNIKKQEVHWAIYKKQG